jgi:hypothetical protein
MAAPLETLAYLLTSFKPIFIGFLHKPIILQVIKYLSLINLG